MKLLRLSIYVFIVLAIAKFTGGNSPQMTEEAGFKNVFTFKADPQLEQHKRQEVLSDDSATYLNSYSNLPLNHKPMYMKSNYETSFIFMRLYQTNDLQNRKSDSNFSFIAF